MSALTLAQALIALLGHGRALVAWVVGLVVCVGVMAAGSSATVSDLFLRAELGYLASDPPHTLETKRPPWRFGRGAHAAIVAAQVAVEIRVEPKPRAHRPIIFGRQRNRTAPEDPTRATLLQGGFQQWIPGEAAPRFQLRANAFFVTDNRDQITRAAATERGDQLGQQTRCKRLSPNIEIDVSFHQRECILQLCEGPVIALDDHTCVAVDQVIRATGHVCRSHTSPTASPQRFAP